MASKRDYAALDGEDSVAPATKRAKAAGRGREHQNANIDPTWGQKYVFSSLDDETTVPHDPDMDFEDDADAMAYVRAVRQEASAIPHLLVAPKHGPRLPQAISGETHDGDAHVDRSIYENGDGDFRGYYHDGAYTAVPDEWAGDDEDAEARDSEDGEYGYDDYDAAEEGEVEDGEVSDAPTVITQIPIDEAYYTSVRLQFLALRAYLRTEPPPSAIAALPRNHSPIVSRFGAKSNTFRVWDHRLRSYDPLPVQIAAMDREGVLRVLQVLLGGKFLRLGIELRERTSRWLWALLARLPDAGELDGGDVAWIRDLGKRAVLLTRSLAEMAALREALGQDGRDLGVNEAVDDESDDDEEVANEMDLDEGRDMHDSELASTREGSAGETKQSGFEEGELDETGPAPESVSVNVPKVVMVDDNAQNEREEGEIDDQDGDNKSTAMSESSGSSLEDARARLLARLDSADDAPDEAEEEDEDEETLRARMNMRATLNMILTVAGEFYGQRDLLQFRDPFPGL